MPPVTTVMVLREGYRQRALPVEAWWVSSGRGKAGR